MAKQDEKQRKYTAGRSFGAKELKQMKEVECKLQNTEAKDDGDWKKCVRQSSMFSGIFTMESE